MSISSPGKGSLSRRQLLRAESLGAAGLTLPALLAGRRACASTGKPSSSFGRAKRCILLFLTGGPPQHDTWDPKPDAPAEIRGEFAPIRTNVSGIRFTELFPKLARHAEKLCVVRSVTHDDTVHTSAGSTMLAGYRHPLANAKTASDIRPGRDHWPHAQTILMAGAGTPKGAVYGSTDPHGAYPDEHPITPPDLAATILHRLGIRPDLELRDRLDRPFLACTGSPVPGLG